MSGGSKWGSEGLDKPEVNLHIDDFNEVNCLGYDLLLGLSPRFT